jgi:hypothetical protein
MAVSIREAEPRGSAEFVESSVLEAVVPADTSFDIEEGFGYWNGHAADESSSIVPFVKERQFLLFGKVAKQRAHSRHLTYSEARR